MMYDVVWRLFSVYGLPPSRIDEVLGLPDGRSRVMLTRIWERAEGEGDDQLQGIGGR